MNLFQKVKNVFPLYRNYLDYHQDRFIDHSVLILKNKIVALFPQMKMRLKFVLMALTFWLNNESQGCRSN
jgi:hypothetical protein